jgi:hypothetical protein
MYTSRVFLDCAVRGLARHSNIFKEYSVRLTLHDTKHVQNNIVKGTK